MSQEPPKRRFGWILAVLAAIAAIVIVVLAGPCPPGKPVPAAVPSAQPAPEPEEQQRQLDPESVSHGSTSR